MRAQPRRHWRARAMRVGLSVRPNAFGNALGSSIGEAISPPNAYAQAARAMGRTVAQQQDYEDALRDGAGAAIRNMPNPETGSSASAGSWVFARDHAARQAALTASFFNGGDSGGDAALSGPRTVTVQAGDGLERIARAQYGENWRAGIAALAAANGITSTDRYGNPIVRAGASLVVPGLDGVDAASQAMLSRAGGGIVAANTQVSAAVRAAEQAMHDEAVTRRLSADFFDPGAGVDPYAGMPGDWRPNEVDTQGKAMLRRAGEIAVAMKNDPLEAVYGGLKGVVNVVPGTFNLATSALKMSLDGYSYALGDAGEYFRGTDAAQAPIWEPHGDAQIGGNFVGGMASPGVISGAAKLGSLAFAAREARLARIAQESVVSELGNAGSGEASAAATLSRIEGRFAGASREVGFIVDSDSGAILTTARQPYGQSGASFRFSEQQWSMAEGNWITHNHPSGNTLGLEDLAGAVSSGARGVRASTTSGVYELAFDNSFASAYRGSPGGAAGFLGAETNAIGAGIMADVRSGALVVPSELTGDIRRGFLANEMWIRYANQTPGLRYTFTPW
jgi:hypothetical protein